MLKVLEHLLMSRAVEKPEYQAYTDAVKDLQTDSMYELRRIAIKMPNQLFVRLEFSA
jgi:exportin-5